MTKLEVAGSLLERRSRGVTLGDAGSEGGSALSANPACVRHGRDGRRRTGRRKTNSGAPLPGAPNVGFRIPADP